MQHTGAKLHIPAPNCPYSTNLCVAVHCGTLQSLRKAGQKSSALPNAGHLETPLSGLFKAWIHLHEINKSRGSSSAVLWQKVSSPRCSIHLSLGHPALCAVLWWELLNNSIGAVHLLMACFFFFLGYFSCHLSLSLSPSLIACSFTICFSCWQQRGHFILTSGARDHTAL